jgi:hypothetical protein
MTLLEPENEADEEALRSSNLVDSTLRFADDPDSARRARAALTSRGK